MWSLLATHDKLLKRRQYPVATLATRYKYSYFLKKKSNVFFFSNLWSLHATHYELITILKFPVATLATCYKYINFL